MNWINRQIVFFFTLCLSAFLWAKTPSPTVEELPTPFCYIENLYFQPKTSTFFVTRNPSLPAKVMTIEEKRGYTFKNTSRRLRPAKQVDGTTLFLFEGVGSTCCTYHFFHILEHILGHWAYYGDRYFEDVNLIVLGSAGELVRVPWEGTVWEGPNEINKHLLRALFPNAEVKTWPLFVEEFQGETFCFERALTSDRGISYRNLECQKINRMLGFARHSLSKDALKNLADRVHAYAGAKIENSEALRVTYLKRPPPRYLDPSVEEKLLASIQMLDNVSLRVEDFAKLSFKQQIDVVANTDVLISVHGNGLSHALFLPPNAKVIELFSPGTHTVDYRIFAEARGFDYSCIMSGRGIISQEESYKMGAVGEFDLTIYDLDIPLVLSRIKPSL